MIDKTVIHLDKICRSCMSTEGNMQNVFENKEYFKDSNIKLAEMLMACSSIEISSEDGLPSSMCSPCENKLVMAYDFKQVTEKSDAILRELLKHSSLTSEENEIEIDINKDFDRYSDSNSSSKEEEEYLPRGCPVPVKKKRSKFKCGVCDKVLRSKRGLKIHQKYCNKVTLDVELQNINVIEHLEITHDPNDQKTENAVVDYTCDACELIFFDVVLYEAHKESHEIKGAEMCLKDEIIEEEIFVKGRTGEDLDGSSTVKDEKADLGKVGKTSLVCNICSKEMRTAAGLKIHMKKHSRNESLTCFTCNELFAKPSQLELHQLEVHNMRNDTKLEKGKKELQCEFCDRVFKYKKSFTHHINTEHGMTDESDFAPSNRNNENDKVDSEGSDDEKNDNVEDLFTDDPTVVKSPRKLHTCHVCQVVFARANHLTRHMTLHRSLLVYKCNQCDNAYATQQVLDKHVENDHINKPYICTICNRHFSRGEHLIRHLKVHQSTSGEDSLKCSICEKVFTRSDHLARHTKVHLLQDKCHVCGECGKAFNRLDNLKTHQRVHSRVKDAAKLHLCVYCGKEFNNSSNMIVHMRRHTGERPYKCSQCGKGFPRSHDLKCHERTHSGEKPYLCTLCGKSFNKSNKLLRHTRVHTGERPYLCTICGRAFTQSNDLALHMRRHTGARPYTCGMCPARFIQSGQLKAHRRSTGHWMETQPDLKGGHRVEPVTLLGSPAPIRFRMKHAFKEEEKVPQVFPPTEDIVDAFETIVDGAPKLLAVDQDEMMEQIADVTNESVSANIHVIPDAKLKIEVSENHILEPPSFDQETYAVALQKSYSFQNYL